MDICTRKIEELKPYDNNAKLHPQEQVEQIKNSIIQFGYLDLIAIDENNVILEGHGRLLALKELGFKEIECYLIQGLTDDEKNAYRIVHNQLTMNTDWDVDKLKSEIQTINIDISNLGLDHLLEQIKDPVEVKEDDFDVEEALNNIKEPTTKRGQMWKLGNHYLMCGDSTSEEDVSKLMNVNKADLVITDPPYNVNYEGGTNESLTIINDNMNNEEFKEFLIKAFANIHLVLNEGAAFYIWHASREQVNFETALNDVGLIVRQQLIWLKSSIVLGRQDYQWKHEPCFYGWKSGASHNWYNDRKQTTILEFDKPSRNGEHPTMKPLELIGYQMKNSSKENDIVLDIFGGSGSTLIACEQLNRTCYMMELDPKYCDVIINRWETLTGKKAELVEE